MAAQADIASDLTPNLIAKYDFNGNAFDSSGNGLDPVSASFSSTYDRFGNADSAIKMDGTNAIEFTYAFPFNDIASDSTVSFWYKAGDNDHESIIWTNLEANADINRFNIYTAQDGFGADYRAPNVTLNTLYSGGISISSWHHIAISREADLYKVFVDSKLVSAYQSDLNTTPTSIGWYIGHRPRDSGSPLHFTGSLDDLALYNRALSGAEIAGLYNNTEGQTYKPEVLSGTTGVEADSGSDFWYGTKCVVTPFPETFETQPTVTVTVNHSQEVHPTIHEPIIIWNEYVTTYEFKSCVKDLVDDKHLPVQLDWTAQ